jgi:hypothetical protein
MLVTSSRILLTNGISIIPEEEAVRLLLSEGQLVGMRVTPSIDSANYDMIYGESIDCACEDIDIIPAITEASHDAIERLASILSNRRDDTDEALHQARVESEIKFFIKTGNVDFLCSLVRLIDRFRSEDIVWGVGRGSSCASYILYLIGVHDINSIKYDIPFKEFSKENEYDD